MTQALTKEQLAGLSALLTGAQPASDSRDRLRQLAEPFAAEATSWRIGPTTKDPDKPKGMGLPYIDARDVMQRLDAVMGADWQDEYTCMPDGSYCCRIGLKIDGEWRWRSDGAVMLVSDKANDDAKEMAQKGSYSDAFKRAAVKWGIGRYLYALDAPWVPVEKRGNSFVLPDASEAQLRRWLANKLGMDPGKAGVDVPPKPTQPQKPAPEKESTAPKGPGTPKQEPKAASVPAAARPSDVIVHPAGDPTAETLLGGIPHTDTQVGRIGLRTIVYRFMAATRYLQDGCKGPPEYTPKGGETVYLRPDEVTLGALNAAFAEWEAWWKAMRLTEDEQAKLGKGLNSYSAEAKRFDAVLAKHNKARAAQAAEHGADPQDGALQYEPVEGVA